MHYQFHCLILKRNSISITSKVAVIGLGNIGKTAARNLVKGNRPVIIASRGIEDAKTLANQLGDLATSAEIAVARSEKQWPMHTLDGMRYQHTCRMEIYLSIIIKLRMLFDLLLLEERTTTLQEAMRLHSGQR